MSSINKIKLPNNTVLDIHDNRISGIDSVPTSNSQNLITSDAVYKATSPIATANYKTSFLSSSTNGNHHMLMSVTPTDWEKVATIEYKITCSIENVESSTTESIVLLQFTKDALRAYYVKNAVTSNDYKSFYQHNYYTLTSAGFSNEKGHLVGLYIHRSTASYSYQGSSSYRLVDIKVLSVSNCTVDLFTQDKKPSDAGQNSTDYNAIGTIASTTGLQETGDTNTTYANYSFGNSYGICSTAASETAKTASITSYALSNGAVTTIYFENAVPANSTLDITDKGAKPIYYRNAAITADIIKAGDTATFRYTTAIDSGVYVLVALDRDFNEYTAQVQTSQPNNGFLPNIVYDLGTLTGSVTFTLASPSDNTIANPYY